MSMKRSLQAALLFCLTAASALAQYTLTLAESQVELRGDLRFTISPRPTQQICVDIVGSGNNRNWETGQPSTPGPDGFCGIEFTYTKSAHSFITGQFTATIVGPNKQPLSNSVTYTVVGPNLPPPVTPVCSATIVPGGGLRVGQAVGFSLVSPNCTITQIAWSSNGGGFSGNVLTPTIASTISVTANGRDQLNRTFTLTSPFQVAAAPPPAVTCTLSVTGPGSITLGQAATFGAFSPNCNGQLSNLLLIVNGVTQAGLTFNAPAVTSYGIVVSADSPSGRISGSTILNVVAAQPPPPSFNCNLSVGYTGNLQVGQQITFTATANGCVLDAPPTMIVTGPGTKTGPNTFIASAPVQITVNFTGFSGGNAVFGSAPFNINPAPTPCAISVTSASGSVEANKPVSFTIFPACVITNATLTFVRQDGTVAYGPFSFGNTNTITHPGLAVGFYIVRVSANEGNATGQSTITVTAAPPARPCAVNVVNPAAAVKVFERAAFKLNPSDGTRIQSGVISYIRPDGSATREVRVTAAQAEFVINNFDQPGNWRMKGVFQTDCGERTVDFSYGVSDASGVIPTAHSYPVSVELFRPSDGWMRVLLGYPNNPTRGSIPEANVYAQDGKPYEYEIRIQVPLNVPVAERVSLFLLGAKFPMQIHNIEPRNGGYTATYTLRLPSLEFIFDGKKPELNSDTKIANFPAVLVEGAMRIEWSAGNELRGGEQPPLFFYAVDNNKKEDDRARLAILNGAIPAGVVVNPSDTDAFVQRVRVGDTVFAVRVKGQTVESSLALAYVRTPDGKSLQLAYNAENRLPFQIRSPGWHKVYGWDASGVEFAFFFWAD